MSTSTVAFMVVGIVLVLGYLLLRFNSLWIYKFFDRSLRNDRNSLPLAYQVPRYFVSNPDGQVDTSARWPGWDGWYFFMLPEDKSFPLEMIRASLMTGLYGLDGTDNYEKLLVAGLSSDQAVEYLTLIPTRERLNGETKKVSRLSQHYLRKATDLAMRAKLLDVAIAAGAVHRNETTGLYGRMSGEWPHFTFQFVNPEGGLKCTLRFQGDKIVWWADVPNIFTYFAAFGTFAGEVIYKKEAGRNGTSGLPGPEGVSTIKGRGGFEHGFARKPFNYDGLWLPIKWVKKIMPALNPIRYHYELFVGDDNCQGGFMYARGFGIDFRNRGGFHLNGVYKPINRVTIDYLEPPAPDIVESSGQPEKFYRSWKVKAETDEGILEYTGTREWPPASITGNMIYYNFSYEGTYLRRRFNGRGYGEYLRM
jgi:hypothetical protein